MPFYPVRRGKLNLFTQTKQAHNELPDVTPDTEPADQVQEPQEERGWHERQAERFSGRPEESAHDLIEMQRLEIMRLRQVISRLVEEKNHMAESLTQTRFEATAAPKPPQSDQSETTWEQTSQAGSAVSGLAGEMTLRAVGADSRSVSQDYAEVIEKRLAARR